METIMLSDCGKAGTARLRQRTGGLGVSKRTHSTKNVLDAQSVSQVSVTDRHLFHGTYKIPAKQKIVPRPKKALNTIGTVMLISMSSVRGATERLPIQ